MLQPGVPDYRVILDSEGNNAGFSTYVEKLFAMAEEMGLKASFSTHIDTIEQSEGGFVLKTATNTVCICSDQLMTHLRLVALVNPWAVVRKLCSATAVLACESVLV